MLLIPAKKGEKKEIHVLMKYPKHQKWYICIKHDTYLINKHGKVAESTAINEQQGM